MRSTLYKRVRFALLVPLLVVGLLGGTLLTATSAFADSGNKCSANATTTAQVCVHIVGPNGTRFVTDIEWTLSNRDVFGTGATVFWLEMSGPGVAGSSAGWIIPINGNVKINKGAQIGGTIQYRVNFNPGTVRISAGADNGWSGAASAVIK